MKAYLWHMVGHGWNKIIETVEKDRESAPISLKGVHEKHMRHRGRMERIKGLVPWRKKSV